MFRHLLAGATAIALTMGAAYAQDSVSSQSTTVTTTPVDSVSKSTTTKSTDAFGNETREHHSFEKSQAMTPDGDTVTTTREHSSAGVVSPSPMAPPPTSSSTTTTTETRTSE
jgi:hypothetical protein